MKTKRKHKKVNRRKLGRAQWIKRANKKRFNDKRQGMPTNWGRAWFLDGRWQIIN